MGGWIDEWTGSDSGGKSHMLGNQGDVPGTHELHFISVRGRVNILHIAYVLQVCSQEEGVGGCVHTHPFAGMVLGYYPCTEPTLIYLASNCQAQ